MLLSNSRPLDDTIIGMRKLFTLILSKMGDNISGMKLQQYLRKNSNFTYLYDELKYEDYFINANQS